MAFNERALTTRTRRVLIRRRDLNGYAQDPDVLDFYVLTSTVIWTGQRGRFRARNGRYWRPLAGSALIRCFG